MCGRFAQSQTREEYLAYLADEAERDIAYDPDPIGRYNMAPGTKVLLLSERNEELHLDPVHWGYAPGWWDKPPLINARVETAASSRMLSFSGSTAGRSVLRMAGLSGSVKVARNNPISSIEKTATPFFWRRSAAYLLNAAMKLKDF